MDLASKTAIVLYVACTRSCQSRFISTQSYWLRLSSGLVDQYVKYTLNVPALELIRGSYEPYNSLVKSN